MHTARVVSQKTYRYAKTNGHGTMARSLAVGVLHTRGFTPRTLRGERSTPNPNTMYRSFLSCAALALTLFAGAQSEVRKVFVLSEGYYDYFGGGGQLLPVTLDTYDPVSGTYQTAVTIVGPRFGSDVLVDQGHVYVAADDRILRYDADSYTELGMQPVQGVRKLAIWGDKLLLTRGELGGLSHYFEVRDKVSLDLLWTLEPTDGLTRSAEDVVVIGDKAYLAVNNSFDWDNLSGLVGVVDLIGQSYGPEIDLGPDGLNPEKLFVSNGALHAFNNKDFTGSSISTIDVNVGSLTHTVNVALNSGCAASVMAEEKIYYMEYDQGLLARYDIASASITDTLIGSPAVYGLLDDPINGVIYATTTDFLSTGELFVLDLEGQVISSVTAGVSAGNMALDVRSSTGIAARSTDQFGVFPNPATEEVFLELGPRAGSVGVTITDATGRVVLRSTKPATARQRVALGGLVPGAYAISVAGVGTARFTKN